MASMISAHSASVEVSHQSLTGASVSPALLTATNPCCWPETASARAELRTAGSMREKASFSAVSHQSHCCSATPFSPWRSASGAEATATTSRRSTSWNTSLSAWVPRSMPTAVCNCVSSALKSWSPHCHSAQAKRSCRISSGNAEPVKAYPLTPPPEFWHSSTRRAAVLRSARWPGQFANVPG